MKTILLLGTFLVGVFAFLAMPTTPEPALAPLRTQGEVAFPKFRMEEIEKGLKVGYAVLLVDLGDGKKDIIVVDTTRVVWYENPTWKRRTIIENQNKPDNVCIAAYDIDGDGQLDLALGAEWKPANTKSGGTLQWLKRGKTLEEPWTIHPIDTEPTCTASASLTWMATARRNSSSGRSLAGNSTENNWLDGPVRLTAYRIPADPIKQRWQPLVLNESLHVMHNFWPIPATGRKGMDVLAASYEGVNLIAPDAKGLWHKTQLGIGNQNNPKGSRGASEIKQGKLKNGRKVIATIEPWHGNQVVVYTEPTKAGALWDRHVIDGQLKWGHAVWFADLDGDGGDELIIGVRNDIGQKPGEHRGVRIYKVLDERGSKWAARSSNRVVSRWKIWRWPIWMAMAGWTSWRWAGKRTMPAFTGTWG